MKTLKQRLVLSVILVGAFCFAGAASAMAYTNQGKVVTFDPANGSAVTTAVVNASNYLTVPNPPKKEGYLFVGWGFTEKKSPEKITDKNILFWNEQDDQQFEVTTTYYNVNAYPRLTAFYAKVKGSLKMDTEFGYGFLTEHSQTVFNVLYGSSSSLGVITPYDVYEVNINKALAIDGPGQEPPRTVVASPDGLINFDESDDYLGSFMYDADGYYISQERNLDQGNNYYDNAVETNYFFPTKAGKYYAVVTPSQGYTNNGSGFYTVTVSSKKVDLPKLGIRWVSEGKTVKTTTPYPGQDIVAPTVTRSGYNFAGWYTSSNFTRALNTTADKAPAQYISYFAKWINRDTHIKAVKTTRGVWVEKWNEARRVNTLKFRSKSGKLSFYAKPKFKVSKVYIKTGKTWKKGTKVRLTVKPGKTKVFYYKVVSEAGTNKARVYKVVVKNKQAK